VNGGRTDAGTRRRAGGWKRALFLCVCAFVPAVPAVAQCPDGTPPPCGPVLPRLRRIQVLAFETGGDTTVAHVASALTDDIVADLRSSGSVAVLGAGAARAGAEFVLTGRVGPTADGFEVTARLEQATSRRVAWTTRMARLRRALPGTAAELSNAVLRAIGLRASAQHTVREPDPQVYDLVLRARYQMSRRTDASLARAAALLRQAIARDTASALGWVWLTRYYFYTRLWGRPVPGVPTADSVLALEVQAAERAVELDPTNPAVWMARGQVAQDVAPGSRSAAVAALRRAVAMDSGQADAWRLLGTALEDMGEVEEALTAFRRAVALAPDDGEYLTFMALHYLWQRDYATAARWADSAVAMDPTLPIARSAAGQVAFWQGRLGEAEEQSLALSRLANPDIIGFAHEVHLRAARGDTAGARLAQEATRERSVRLPSLHATIATADGFVALGDTAAALAVLEAFAVPADYHFQMHLRYERGFDSVREAPRFRALLARRAP
jgi:tetratricopeptide (TPR) repeat protein